ncbi:hypothetical protein ACFLZE_03875 [Thermodesulfobacteriota bacterium]
MQYEHVGRYILAANNDQWTDLELVIPDGSIIRLSASHIIPGDNTLLFIGDQESEELGLFVSRRPNQTYVKLISGFDILAELERIEKNKFQ